MGYYAHSLEGQPETEWQLLSTHLQNTAELASCFAEDFGCGSLARIFGLLHDLGKYSQEFQNYLAGKTPNAKVDHSTAGARFLAEKMPVLKTFLASEFHCDFRKSVDKSKLIDEDSVAVLVPFGEGELLLRQLREAPPIDFLLLREHQRHTVNIRKDVFRQHFEIEFIRDFCPALCIIRESRKLKDTKDYLHEGVLWNL